MNNIIMNASNILISELKSNRRYMSLSMRMFSTRENLNHVAVTEAFIDNIIANKEEYICMPLCADVPKMKKKDYHGLTHLYDAKSGTFLADVIGGFYDFEKVSDEFGISLIGHARVNKRIEAVCTAIEELYANNALNFSFEISAGELREENGITIVDASDNNELTAMAVVSVPAYPESKALDLVAEAKPTIEDFYENTKFIAAEMDLETVRRKFFDALWEYKGDEAWHLRPVLFCYDCVILYDDQEGKSYKCEYIVQGDELILKDFYEIKFMRAEKGSENEMEMNEAMKAELEEEEAKLKAEPDDTPADAEGGTEGGTEGGSENTGTTDPDPAESDPVEEPVVEPAAPEENVIGTEPVRASGEAETTVEVAEDLPIVEEEQEDRDDPEDQNEPEDKEDEDELIALRKHCAELEAQIEALNQVKAELDQIKAEREKAELDEKKAELREYAIAEGLNVEDETVARAIDEMDHAALMSEVMSRKNSKKEADTQVAYVASFDIGVKGTSYLFGHSKK